MTANAKTVRPLRRDAQRNRERIVAAARDVFAERGVGATLDDVAERAGVGVGTVYRRYPNKDALLDDLFEESLGALARHAEECLSHPDAWEALTAFVEHLVERFAENRALMDLVLRSERGLRRVASARKRLDAPVAALVLRARGDGRLRPDFEPADIWIVARMLAAVIDEIEPGERRRRYFVILVDGLATKRSTPTPLAAAPRR